MSFDVDQFLAQPLTARVATNGPTVRPTWFLWEDGAFWILTGPWARLPDRVRADPAIALVVDDCDLATVQRKFPTGALATITFECEWRDLAAGSGQLTGLVRPKDLNLTSRAATLG